MKSSSSVLILLICILSIAFAQKQIDTFNMLLPQIYQPNNGKPIQLVIAKGGCFEWISSDQKVISVKQMSQDNSKCYSKGLVSQNHIGSYGSSVYITAINSQTQQPSNIPVRIRPISRIEIIAKSRMMNILQRQDLSIFAYDKEHNMFTSLEGLKFRWEFVENKQVLDKITLANSHLTMALDQRKNIQKKGAESDIIVIKGLNPGKAIIKVKCLQPGYQHLSNQITISVHQRFDILPMSPVYMLVSSKTQFLLQTPSAQLIQIPKSFYVNTIGNSFTVSDTLQVSSPSQQSQAILKVQDTRTSPTYYSEVTVYSKSPDQIRLKVQQYIVVGQDAIVSVQLYWKGKLLTGYSDQVQITSGELIYNKNKKTIHANTRTSVIVKATYGKLSVEKKVVTVLPLKAILPTDHVILPVGQTFQLKIVGGSGSYDYRIGSDIATISSGGYISTKKEGSSQIAIIDRKSIQNKLTIRLISQALRTLIPLQSRKQLNVNKQGVIFTLGLTSSSLPYTQCRDQPINLQLSHLSQFESSLQKSLNEQLNGLIRISQTSKIVKTKLNKHSLFNKGIQQFVKGFEVYYKAMDAKQEDINQYAKQLQNYGICSVHKLTSKLKFDNQIQLTLKTNPKISAKFNIRVYDDISNSVLNYENINNFVMTPLSTLRWQTTGGSYEWTQKTKIFINDQQVKDKYPIITCADKQATLQKTLTYINPQSPQLLLPVNQSQSIKIHCKYPSSLIINYQYSSFQLGTIYGLRNQVVKGWLIPLDQKKQEFFNSTNLVFNMLQTMGLKLQRNHFEYTPRAEVPTKIAFWSEKVQGISKPFNKVSVQFMYQPAQLFQISPRPVNNYLLTFYNPKTTYNFQLKKISNNVGFTCNGSITCNYIVKDNKKQIIVTTTSLGMGYMIVKDKSLYNAPSLTIKFQIVHADRIVLKTSSQLVQVHKQLTAQVFLYYGKQLIPTWQYQQKNLILTHQSGLRSIPSQIIPNKFTIKCQKPGSYNLQVLQQSPKFLQSQKNSLIVYEKLDVNLQNVKEKYQQNVLMVEGDVRVANNCVRKVHINGGPKDIVVQVQKNTNIIQIRQLQNHQRYVEIYGLQKGSTQLKFTVKQYKSSKTLAIITINVNVRPIQKAVINTLDEALINAQFRIIPHLLIDNVVLLDSVCDLQYKWSVNPNIKIKSLGNRAALNATAIQVGNGLISLQISTRSSHSILFNCKKTITIHKSLQLQLPTIIGEHNPLQSSNLLIPPNSGYSFDKDIQISPISPCDGGMIKIYQNQLHTKKDKGVHTVKLNKKSDPGYNSLMNVIITDIKQLFIHNQFSQVEVALGANKQLKFYVLDKYGRLFYNNLHNIQFEAISSNQQIFTTQISKQNQFIEIKPVSQGQALLILKLKSSTTQQLLQIPHDIVTIQVGKIIQPSSPIYLLIGGQVHIQYHGTEIQAWETLIGHDKVSINQHQRIIKAKSIGEVIIIIGGYTVTIRVVALEGFYKNWLTDIKHIADRTILQYTPVIKWNNQQIQLPSLTNSHNYINNNLKLRCQASLPKWFKTKSYILKSSTSDKLICQFMLNNQFSLQDQVPNSLQWKIINQTSNQIIQDQEQKLQKVFFVPKNYQLVKITSTVPHINIPIKTALRKLVLEVIGGENSWISTSRSSEDILLVHINLSNLQSQVPLNFQLKISSSQSSQSQLIPIKYFYEQSQKSQDQSFINNGSFEIFSGWQWTQILTILVSLVLAGNLIYSCFDDEGKYKIL